MSVDERGSRKHYCSIILSIIEDMEYKLTPLLCFRYKYIWNTYAIGQRHYYLLMCLKTSILQKEISYTLFPDRKGHRLHASFLHFWYTKQQMTFFNIM